MTTPAPERAAALAAPGPALLFAQRVLARHGGTLRLNGHENTRFIHGRSPIQALRAQPFDLVLLDCETPGISALDVLAWVRRTLGSDLPVMLLGERSEDAHVAACFAAGADA